MKKQMLWTPTRRELLLTGSIGLFAGCGGGGSVTPGATPTPIPTPTPGSTPTPTPSPVPSGRRERFGYVERTAGGYRLASVRTDGTDYQPVNMPEQPNVFYPSWSRNGHKIAYVVQDFVTNRYSLYTLNADGSDHALYSEGLEPSWNATGTQLTFLTVHSQTTPTPRNWMAIHAYDVVKKEQVFPLPGNSPPVIFEGGISANTTLRRPLWRGDRKLSVSYSAQNLVDLSSSYGLLDYTTATPSPILQSSSLGCLLYDTAPDDGMGIVRQGTKVYWLSGESLSLLKTTSNTGGGRFSPDGERLWIDLENGKGARFYDRSLKDAGAPSNLPNSVIESWFFEA
ncbi:TolB family protein [Armatimonas rosea]|uniref:WD40 repeat protein n=1 Tax=Armatimonas rosea TaxID=685828 RepID=A0A7W9ST20_ARMRO|nr:hypothetical protein [Armatimonas rosea]MBB6052332.1 hypothetical protein [Armatimonas rosea]